MGVGGLRQLCTPKSCDKKFFFGGNFPLLIHVWIEALHASDDACALNGLHLRELGLCALGCASAQMAFAAFGSHELARACQAKTLGCRLVSLELDLFARFLLLASHSNLLLSDKIKRGL